MKKIHKEKKNNLTITHPELMKEWDYELNKELKPEYFTKHSDKKVWWKCEKGHKHKCYISNKTTGKTKCPYCSGRLPIVGETDLETLYPQIASEWNYKKNKGQHPKNFTSKSGEKVWWVCEHGHEWEAKICNRTIKFYSCPYCSNKKAWAGFNDLETTHPHLASMWHPTKNGDLTPKDVTYGRATKVWWRCENGHEWEGRINDMTRRKELCGYCSGREILEGYNDLATTHPELIKLWDFELNKNIKPYEVGAKSNKKAYWRCGTCFGGWYTKITHVTSGSGCPYCSGQKVLIGFNDLATTHPELAKEWHPTKNKELTPEKITSGSNRKVWWRCENGHEWESTVANRKSGKNCPICSESKGEKRISLFLSENKIDFKREYIFKECKDEGYLRFDFVIFMNNEIVGAIEYDGEFHYHAYEYSGGEVGLQKTKKRDGIKNQYCLDKNIPLLRIPYWDYNSIELITGDWLKTL